VWQINDACFVSGRNVQIMIGPDRLIVAQLQEPMSQDAATLREVAHRAE
jgi:hypothetical protein